MLNLCLRLALEPYYLFVGLGFVQCSSQSCLPGHCSNVSKILYKNNFSYQSMIYRLANLLSVAAQVAN